MLILGRKSNNVGMCGNRQIDSMRQVVRPLELLGGRVLWHGGVLVAHTMYRGTSVNEATLAVNTRDLTAGSTQRVMDPYSISSHISGFSGPTGDIPIAQ